MSSDIPEEPRTDDLAGLGVEAGDVVFVIGNPGSTNRLRTVSQLQYQRDVQVPVLKHFLETRLESLQEFYELLRTDKRDEAISHWGGHIERFSREAARDLPTRPVTI